jgi:hypothetical protein
MFSSTPTMSTVQEFFKTAVANNTSRYNNNNNNINKYQNEDIHGTRDTSDYCMENHPNSSTGSSSGSASNGILPGTMNLFLHHHESKANQNNSNKKGLSGMTESEIKKIVYDTESFHMIQEQLRTRYMAQTNAMVKQVGVQLVRERFLDQQQQQQQRERTNRVEQRKLQIAKELTEARIKSRQALQLMHPTMSKDNDDNDEAEKACKGSSNDDKTYDDDVSNNSNTNRSNNSPTSVLSTLDVSDVTSFKGDLMIMDCDSEDGDIQEVEE